MLKLQFKDQRKAAIWLVDSRYSLGRDTSNDIIVSGDGVSGFHAEIRVEDDDRIFLTDAGSATGTSVNGKPIKARTQLRPGDIIKIHDVEMQLVDPKAELEDLDCEDGATALTPALQGIQTGSEPGLAAPVKGGNSGWYVKAKTGSSMGKIYPLPKTGKVVLGRSQSCDIVLPGNHVSRQHAELRFSEGRLYVKDLGSSNGTYVNRKKVQEGVVHSGDELRFDTLVFQVIGPADAGDDDNADKTSFRAAISLDEPNTSAPSSSGAASTPGSNAPPAKAATAASGSNKPVAPASAATNAQKPAAQPAPAKPEKSGGKGVMIALVVVVVAIGAGAAWLFI